MDSLLKTALAGTARLGEAPTATTPAEALVPVAAGVGAERRVLLAAGARAAYRRAGLMPGAAIAPAPAPDDPTPACSPGAAALMVGLARGMHVSLLPEALERLARAGRRLPHALLAESLHGATGKVALRPAMLAVIGARGHWLAARHPEWHWAAARSLADAPGVPDDAEARWETGDAAQRVAILSLVRRHDPARGRAWLAATWKKERADFRAECLGVLGEGLSLDDEPFLEAALGDRSQAVRTGATDLLVRLPESALARRVRDQADTMLDFTPGLLAGGILAAAKALAAGSAGGKLTAEPPETFDKAWARDGIEEKPPSSVGQRAWWLRQFLALVPPAHWSTRFATDPATLIAAAGRTVWVDFVILGWTQATITHRDADWSVALWRHWLEGKFNRKRDGESGSLAANLARWLPQPVVERLVLAVLEREGGMDPRLTLTIRLLPRPWSAPFAGAMLAHLHTYLRDTLSGTPTYQDPWLALIDDVAHAIPPECFAEARPIQSFMPREETEAANTWWYRRIADFVEVVRLRQQLVAEIPL